jgi:hypothetical protein
MPTDLRRYRILQWIYVLCAVAVALAAYRLFPVAGHIWAAAAAFAVFALVTELLTVNLADESLADGVDRRVRRQFSERGRGGADCAFGGAKAVRASRHSPRH